MKICPNCRNTFEDDEDMFCDDCGLRLVEAEAQETKISQEIPKAAPAFETEETQKTISSNPISTIQQPAEKSQYTQQYAPPAKPKNNYDHSSEFGKEEVAKNKILAVTSYLFGFLGMIVAALVGKDSEYVSFHIKQALKITIFAVIACIATSFISVVLILIGGFADMEFFVVLGAILIAAVAIFILIINIISIIQALRGKSIEPVIVRNFK